MRGAEITVHRASQDFREWDRLLQLLRAAFANQEHRINPPSSVHLLDLATFAEKASQEILFVAILAPDLAGCVFARDQPLSLHVSKLAVWPHLQRRGIGRELMGAVEGFARESGRTAL